MSDTKRLLVHTANTFVPVSVIIIGVGRANKEKMKILDGDNRTLTSNEGVRAKRDIVQFVELRKFLMNYGGGQMSWNKEALAKEVLAEVPKQLVAWMTKRGIKPNNPPK